MGLRITSLRSSKKVGRHRDVSSNPSCRCLPVTCSSTAMRTTGWPAFRGDRLVNVLPVVDQEGLVRDLRQVYKMLNSGLAVSSEPMIPVGAKVRIMTGPLTGIIGTVIRRGNRDQFVAVVNFLGRGATVDLEDWQVEQVGRLVLCPLCLATRARPLVADRVRAGGLHISIWAIGDHRLPTKD